MLERIFLNQNAIRVFEFMYAHDGFKYTEKELNKCAKVNESALGRILNAFVKYGIIKEAEGKYTYSDSKIAQMLGRDMMKLAAHVNEILIKEESLEKKVE